VFRSEVMLSRPVEAQHHLIEDLIPPEARNYFFVYFSTAIVSVVTVSTSTLRSCIN
jgi:hypothetical protein